MADQGTQAMWYMGLHNTTRGSIPLEKVDRFFAKLILS
jgi:hypothetical protein